jgi:probable phosphoglycerate mutase
MSPSLKIFTDGGARGNPGPAAIGVVISEGNKLIHQFGQTIGKATNNIAEYRAVIGALEWVSRQDSKPAAIEFFLDSKLVVEQLKGNWKIKEPHLKDLALAAHTLMQKLGTKVSLTSVPRAQNAAADRLVNAALDKC